MGGIRAAYVQRRIGLGQAVRLRLGENRRVVAAIGGHAGEDEVARAVHDAEQRVDFVGQQAVQQRADHRHAADATCPEADARAAAAGGGEQLAPAGSQQGLVGRHHALAGRQRFADHLLGERLAPDELDDDVHPLVAQRAAQVAVADGLIRAGSAGGGVVDIHHVAQFKDQPAATGQPLGVGHQQPNDMAADGAAADKRNAYGLRFGHDGLLAAELCSLVQIGIRGHQMQVPWAGVVRWHLDACVRRDVEA